MSQTPNTNSNHYNDSQDRIVLTIDIEPIAKHENFLLVYKELGVTKRTGGSISFQSHTWYLQKSIYRSKRLSSLQKKKNYHLTNDNVV